VGEADLPLALDLIKAGRDGPPAPAAMEAIGRRHGVDPYRAAYVVTKFGAGLLMVWRGLSPGEAAEAFGTPLAVPTPEELEAIRALAPGIKSSLGVR
jgi:hypothetical protein